jgi:hypothetical protein
MHVLNTGTNQHGKLVLSFLSTAFVERRPGAAACRGTGQ